MLLLLLLEPKPKPPVVWLFCWPKPPKPPNDMMADVAETMASSG